MSAITMDVDSCSTVNQAARIGNLKTMCCLIKEGHPVDVSDNRGWKAIHEAARGNYVKCMEVLLKQEATDVNWVSFEEASALLVSAEHGHVACLRLLLDGGADPNLADNMWNTPLLAATKAHSLACVELLVADGADINCQQYCGTSPLHQAASEGLDDILSYLVEKKARLDVMEEYHISPVFSAAQYGQTGCLKILLDSDKDTANSPPCDRLVNCAAEDGATPLFLAAQEGHTDCLRLLLQHGADANMTTLEPVALPLHAALQFAHVQCVKLLLPHTDHSVLTNCHASVFNFASMHESRQCTRCLVAAGLDVNARHRLSDDDASFVPKLLHYIEHDVVFSRELCPLSTVAFYRNHVSSAEVLLASGSDPNGSSLDDVPPLLPALDAGNLDLVRLLVAHGARVNTYHPNMHGNLTLITCLHFWRGLMFMLKCGAEVGSFLKSRDASNHDGAVSFLQTVIGAKYLMSQAGISIGLVIYRMLQFVGPLTLNACVEQVLDSATEWNSIAELIGSPRSLMHSCRLVIRDCVGSRHLVNDECFRDLGLPPPVVDYLSYKDL